MKWWLGSLLFVLLLIGFGFWLGWGRVRLWSEVSGWSKLTEAEQVAMRAASAAYSVLENRPELHWLGHATMALEWGGLRLVADPVNSRRVKVAPRLFSEPVLPDDLPVDAVLLTHAHMDHMDNATLERMASTRLYLPSGSERFLSESVRARHEIIPLQMGEVTRLGDLEIIPVDAEHGGWRYPWQRGLFACGYVIRHKGEALYLAGDTAMGQHFAQIGAAYAPRYAVLPVGAYAPEWFLRCRHLNPEEALEAATDLGAEFVVPYHFGTFRLSLEPVDAPLRRWATGALAGGQKWLLPIDQLVDEARAL